MSPELAALLDGPVASRFGRPCLLGSHYLRPCPRNGPDEWRWLSAEWHSAGLVLFPEHHWLDHLLSVCGERGWTARFHPPSPEHGKPDWLRSWLVSIVSSRDNFVSLDHTEEHSPTLLEALSRAMLAVPEGK